MLHTHTPGRSRVNPERQKEEQGEHRRRAEGQNSAGGGGEQTDLQNQPTPRNDLTKTAHTPKPHDTLRRGTRGQLGTKWGLVDDKQKTKQLIKQQDSVPNYMKVVRYSLSGTVVKSCPKLT